MQLVILAAGMGKRLKTLTEHNTKCMIKVNGITLIERMLCQLDNKNLSKIIIVVGYKSKELIEFIKTLKIKTPIIYLKNNIYYKTNNIYSLALAKKYLEKEDTLLFESDLIFEDSVIDELLNDKYDTLALVDKYESWMDGTCLKLDENNYIESFISNKNFKNEDVKKYYKTVNIYKFSKHFSKTHYVPFLEAYCKALGNNEYYEQVLKVIAMLDNPEIKAKKLNGQLWYEIDDIQDLDIASSIFTNSKKEKLSVLKNRYGGYWRYPKLLDFCYLVNPYFPSQRLINEIKSNLNEKPSKPTTILSREAAFIVLDMLAHQSTPGVKIPFAKNQPKHITHMWKTGTSSSYRDAWTAGIFGDYVLIIWVGNFDGTPNNAFSGARAAAPIYFALAQTVVDYYAHTETPVKNNNFLDPDMNISQIEMCDMVGGIAGEYCPKKVSAYFIPGKSPIDI